MRYNVFEEACLDEGDSIIDFIMCRGLGADLLMAWIDPDDNGSTFSAEVITESGESFFVTGYPNVLELEQELRNAGINSVEITE